VNIRSPLFSHIIPAKFIRRLNRFAVECDLKGETIIAHLPNPGRLWELLIPGVCVYLAPNNRGTGKRYSCVAVNKAGRIVLLHTQMANTVARLLIEEGLIPGLEGARVKRTEVRWGRHRFDFLLEQENQQLLLEVKSCTLFGERVAMFPDAVTVRGKNHVLELARMQEENLSGGILFLVSTRHVSYFSPDYHTDLTFSQALIEARERLFIKAVGISWQEDLIPEGPLKDIPIPWEVIEQEAQDRGAYLLILEVPQAFQVPIGSLGTCFIRAGFHIYVGSARANLKKRLERHLRCHKKPFWHIDYLRPYAVRATALPIRTARNIEHELAYAIQTFAQISIPRFGASDCHCPTHLFFLDHHPLEDREFLELLAHERMDYLAYLST